jgi:hypothetical protein
MGVHLVASMADSPLLTRTMAITAPTVCTILIAVSIGAVVFHVSRHISPNARAFVPVITVDAMSIFSVNTCSSTRTSATSITFVYRPPDCISQQAVHTYDDVCSTRMRYEHKLFCCVVLWTATAVVLIYTGFRLYSHLLSLIEFQFIVMLYGFTIYGMCLYYSNTKIAHKKHTYQIDSLSIMIQTTPPPSDDET